MINRVVNSTLIQKDIIIFSSYNVVVRLTFDFEIHFVFIERTDVGTVSTGAGVDQNQFLLAARGV